MAPLMFAGLIFGMVIGYPAAFSIAAVGLFFGFIGVELGLIRPDFLGNLTFQMFAVISNDLLLAIPFFTLMGTILERCGLAEDLLEGFGQLFGGLRGGLSYAVIIVGAVLGAITGTVAASVIAMGLISLPVMLKYGYSKRHATGVIAASGTITQLVPPSLVLVVLADQLGRSVGDMYKGAIGPSLIQIALFMGWVAILSVIRPQDVPALPPEARTLRGWAAVLEVHQGHGAVADPDLPRARHHLHGTGDADGSRRHGRGRRARPRRHEPSPDLGAALAGHGNDHAASRPSWSSSCWARARSAWCSRASAARNGSKACSPALPGGVVGFLIFVNVFVFILAFFLDFFEIAFIIIPLLAPVAEKLGIDLIWFGVLLGANMQTSFMHPPFGFALFYLRGIVSRAEVPSSDIYWGAIPWVFLQLHAGAPSLFSGRPRSPTSSTSRQPWTRPRSRSRFRPSARMDRAVLSSRRSAPRGSIFQVPTSVVRRCPRPGRISATWLRRRPTLRRSSPPKPKCQRSRSRRRRKSLSRRNPNSPTRLSQTKGRKRSKRSRPFLLPASSQGLRRRQSVFLRCWIIM